jgi:purine-nucleoside phosphorylase
MGNDLKHVRETASFLKDRLEVIPDIGIMTGTGLGSAADGLHARLALEYDQIPHFPAATVQSHRGRLLCGTLAGSPVMAMQGRFHLYEGYSPLQVTFPVRVMQTLGIHTLIVSNAAGGVNPAFSPGDIMVIADHINLTGANPLVGPNIDPWGPRFPDMARAYDPALAGAARAAGRRIGARLQRGVYAGLTGPSLETPAEIRFLQTIGSDAVGFSTIQEVIAAVHASMRVLGLSIITNVHQPRDPVPARVDDIIAVAETTAPVLARLIHEVVGTIGI